MEWWDIPVFVVGWTIGTYLGTALSNWVKVKSGWMDPLPKKIRRGKQLQ